ncbi:MAG: ferrous iron transport protein B [Clostridiales bacterium]|jgi:ferrous iron transport protein B|nr:ferrous iron transport protein B [Clostridiales bacterium]
MRGEYTVALAGNPNVGKSTVFNALTGMRQHTGNWPGKTVSSARGRYTYGGQGYTLVDLPGAYSLLAHSAEEEVARDFLCFGHVDAICVVCDATCLERNLNLALQVLEISAQVVVCVNLMDEAKKKDIVIDLIALRDALGVPVAGVSARDGVGLAQLQEHIRALCQSARRSTPAPPVTYAEPVEYAVSLLRPAVQAALAASLPHGAQANPSGGETRAVPLNARFISLKLLEGGYAPQSGLPDSRGLNISRDKTVKDMLDHALAHLLLAGFDGATLKDHMVSALFSRAEAIAQTSTRYKNPAYQARQIRLDRILTGRRTGVPIMLLLLAIVFYITIEGANIPSQWLQSGLFWVEERLTAWFMALGAPAWLHGALVQGAYRVLAWVVSVMLPPMLIFFPLFTLLEDLGYLPRVAFNLDRRFRRAGACGKQALTMCMGFGCNAAGIMGCRVIDSPRERLIAILTNNFVPCNGRFPILISIIGMFFAGTGATGTGAAGTGAAGTGAAALWALLLTAAIALGVGATFLASSLLSKTVLKGRPSAFTLELPPCRKPQIGKVIVRAVMDRAAFVLGRAAAIALPMGIFIWLAANMEFGGATVLRHMTGFLDPFARVFGLDGVILTAFILGLPANEIVMPLIVMAYMAEGSLIEPASPGALKALLVQNGWTWTTALCTMLFSLMHWPCSTALLTIKKETQSVKWAFTAFLLPTLFGLSCCFFAASAARLLAGL